MEIIRKNKIPKILIIGANGFIGSSLVRRFLDRDYSVIAIIGEYGLKYLKDIKNPKLKVCSAKEIKDNFGKLGTFKFLFNLSGDTDIRESFIDPLKYEINKPITTIKLIENCKTEKFINISTASVYNFAYNPVNEESPLRPNSPYAISQLTADYYTEVLCKNRKIPYLVLRIFNPYGPPNIRRGIITTIISELLGGKVVTLYNPERKFDFTYIEDISRATDFCAAKLQGIVNVGSGKPISLIDVYKKISYLLFKKYKIPLFITTDKYTEEVFSNSNKLKKSGFKFKYNIDYGLKRTIQYFKNSEM